jgi:hypothetical protein
VQWLEKAESVQKGQNHLHQKIGRNSGSFLKERFHVKKGLQVDGSCVFIYKNRPLVYPFKYPQILSFFA